MAGLANQMALVERDEVAAAIRLLLGRPLVLRSSDPDAFEVVRRRHGPAAMWFDHYLGWQLHLEPRLGYARLVKVPARPDPTRPARRSRSTRAPFDRRRYTLLALIAAELMATQQTVIGALAERVRAACAADEHLPAFDTSRHGERVAFVDALLALEDLGALSAVDGTTQSFAESEQAKVLYRVDTTALLRLLAAPVGPSRLGELDLGAGAQPVVTALLAESRYGPPEPAVSEEGNSGDGAGAGPRTERANLRLRHQVLRRLFDDPVLYRAEMSTAELGYATSISGRSMMRKAAQTAGLILEERAQGWLVVDLGATATDWRFPDDSSTANVAALLLLDHLNAAEQPVPVAQAQEVARHRLAANPNWAKAYQTPDGAARLTDDAVAILVAMGLARADATEITRLPAAARYQVVAAQPKDQQPRAVAAEATPNPPGRRRPNRAPGGTASPQPPSEQPTSEALW